jgi:Ca2+-binding RTX toxin-like protein
MKRPLFVVATTILTLLASCIPVSLANAADPVCTINVTESNTTVQGTNLGDVICITGDNNIVNALGGDDTVIDDGIDNTINLGEGFDIYDGSGGDGSTVDGGPGNDEITGTPGEDELTGGDGDDTLIGGEEDDTLNGGLGADELAGNAGNDLLQGNSGDDSLFGGNGNDKLSGDEGTNSVDGGAGYNVCVASTDVAIGCSVFVTIELKFLYTVSGSLLDWDGLPVSNLRFTFTPAGSESSREATTDASGNFIVAVPAGEYSLKFGTWRSHGPGFPEWWFFDASLDVTKDIKLNLRLPKPTKTLLHVQDADGNPIAGAGVIQKGSQTAGLTYDLGSGLQAHGYSRVSSIMGVPDPTDVNGNTFLYSYGMGYEVEIYSGLGITQTKLISNLSETVTLIKAPVLQSVSGSLLDWDGLPVSNLRFTFTPAGSESSREATTDASGNFIVAVPAGEYSLKFGTWRSHGPGFPEWWFFDASLDVTKDIKLNLRLPKPTKTLLHVQDADGNPIAGAGVIQKGSQTAGLTYDLGSGLQAHGYSRVSSIMGVPDPTDVNGNTFLYSYGMGYEVEIYSGTGSVTRKIIAKSSAPKSLRVESVTGYGFNLCWEKPWDDGGSTITSYLTEWSRDNGLTWSKLSSAGSDGCKTKTSGAEPATSYLLRISALNAAGTSDFATLQVETPTWAPKPPQSVSTTSLSSTSLNLQWQLPTSNGGSAITDYRVEVSSNCSTYTAINRAVSVNLGFKVTGLKAGTKYCFRVSAKNEIGFSTVSSILQVTTVGKAPAAPTSLSVKAAKTSVTLGWKVPAVTGGSAIRNYVVEYSKSNGVSWLKVTKPISTSRSLIVKGLKSKTSYLFRVTAVNDVGNSPASKRLKIVTG